MTNPYNHPGYEHPTEEEAQERELAFILWQKAQSNNEYRELLDAGIRKRTKRRLKQLAIGAVLLGSAVFVVVRYLYLYYFW